MVDPENPSGPKKCVQVRNREAHFKANPIVTLQTCIDYEGIGTEDPTIEQFRDGFITTSGFKR